MLTDVDNKIDGFSQCRIFSYLVKEDLRLAQYMLQLSQLQEVTFQCLRILVDFPQLVLKFLKGGLCNKGSHIREELIH